MTPQTILVVDPDRHTTEALATVLEDLGPVHIAATAAEALAFAAGRRPAVILLDVAARSALAADARLAAVPLVLLGRPDDAAFAAARVDGGAAEFLDRPIDPLLARTRVRTQLRIQELVDALASQSRTDALTGLPDRRAFDEVLDREWRRAERGGDALSVLMIDVDHFAAYNDHEGPAAGDRCLARVGRALGTLALRRGDLVARYGGAKFVFVLPQTPRHGADYMAAQVVAAVDALDIAHAASAPGGKLSVSVGASYYDARSACWAAPRANADFARYQARGRVVTELVRAADRALGAAKRAGRARACALDVADLDRPEAVRELPSAARRASFAERRDAATCGPW